MFVLFVLLSFWVTEVYGSGGISLAQEEFLQGEVAVMPAVEGMPEVEDFSEMEDSITIASLVIPSVSSFVIQQACISDVARLMLIAQDHLRSTPQNGDVCFVLSHFIPEENDGEDDVFWTSREKGSSLLLGFASSLEEKTISTNPLDVLQWRHHYDHQISLVKDFPGFFGKSTLLGHYQQEFRKYDAVYSQNPALFNKILKLSRKLDPYYQQIMEVSAYPDGTPYKGWFMLELWNQYSQYYVWLINTLVFLSPQESPAEGEV